MRILLLGLITVSLISPAVFADLSDPKTLDGFKWGVGLGLVRNGSIAQLDLVSPQIIRIGKEDSAGLSIFLDIGALTLTDVVSSGGKLQNSGSLLGDLGLRSTTVWSDNIQPYVKVAASFLNWDSRLMSSSGSSASWGWLISWGADWFISSKDGKSPMSFNESVFVQLDWRFGHRRTDAITGEPDLFNGNALSLGFRLHY